MPAAVIMATVADPCVILTSAASTQASTIIGIDESASDSASIFPIPLSTRICFRTPPAPVTRIMIPAGPRALVLRSRMVCLDRPCFRHSRIDSSVAIMSAVKGWPMKMSTLVRIVFSSTPLSTPRLIKVPIRIRSSGVITRAAITPNEGRLF